MLALHDLQQAMTRAVITGGCDDAAAAVVPDAPGAIGRLHIYRNHYLVTLLDALAATFPATLAAVGDDHFKAAGRGFILTQPPAEPCLAAYGAGFPAFLAQLPPLAPWPYLADLAQLDWAVNAAFHAPDVPPVDPQRLAAVAEATVAELQARLHPSCRALASAFPIDRIRHALLAGKAVVAAEVTEAPCHLLVFRAGDDVGWLHLPPAAFVFAAALAEDGSLANAAALAEAVDASFDPAAHLAALLTHGVVVDLSTPDA